MSKICCSSSISLKSIPTNNILDNILLKEGDVVRIPYYKTRVKITGNVRREGKFELQKNETFERLLEYCGGFNEVAYKASVQVISITDKNRKLTDLAATNISNFEPGSADEIFVNRLNDKLSNKVSISGSIVRRGNYELTERLTLNELIENATLKLKYASIDVGLDELINISEDIQVEENINIKYIYCKNNSSS